MSTRFNNPIPAPSRRDTPPKKKPSRKLRSGKHPKNSYKRRILIPTRPHNHIYIKRTPAGARRPPASIYMTRNSSATPGPHPNTRRVIPPLHLARIHTHHAQFLRYTWAASTYTTRNSSATPNPHPYQIPARPRPRTSPHHTARNMGTWARSALGAAGAGSQINPQPIGAHTRIPTPRTNHAHSGHFGFRLAAASVGTPKRLNQIFQGSPLPTTHRARGSTRVAT